MESGFCPVCGAELRPNGTAGPSAAELAARLETAEKDTRRMDALEKAAAEWDYFEVIRPYPVSAIYVGDQAGDAAKADTIRALADALEVDA